MSQRAPCLVGAPASASAARTPSFEDRLLPFDVDVELATVDLGRVPLIREEHADGEAAVDQIEAADLMTVGIETDDACLRRSFTDLEAIDAELVRVLDGDDPLGWWHLVEQRAQQRRLA